MKRDAKCRTVVLWMVLMLGGGAVCLAAQGSAQDPDVTWEVVFDPRSHGTRPTGLWWSPEGQRLLYSWSGALWVLRADTGRTQEIARFSDLDFPGSPSSRSQPPSDIQWSPDGENLLMTRDGDLFLYSLKSKRITRLTQTRAPEKDPKFSPDGRTLVFVRDHDLHRLGVPRGRERALTHDGEENVTLNGETDWVYWEELWSRDSTGFWISPQGEQVAYYRFDETPVRTYPLVNFLATYPEVVSQKYPKAGEANPKVSVGVLDLAGGETLWMETGEEDGYLARVTWTPDRKYLAVHRLNREQDRLDLLLCYLDGSLKGKCTAALTEKTSTWVDVEDDFAFLEDATLVWGSDRAGWRRLYLYRLSSERTMLQRALTPEHLAVTSLDGVNEEEGWLIYTAYSTAGLGAAERQVYRVEIETGRNEALASEPGWNSAQVAPGGKFWLHTWSDEENLPRQTLRRLDGTAVATLPSQPHAGYDLVALPKWEYFTIPGPRGSELPARLLKPAGWEPGRRYPAIMYHYGCPASQVVSKRWLTGPRDLWHRRAAQRGYFVLMVDNEGSLFFGKRGAEKLHRRFGDLELDAQMAGVEYLESRGDVDTDRIGLWGWSGGGANTLYSVFRRPGVWKAAVAGAPVTDWRLYDTIWTERYLDRPQDNAEGYRVSSPVSFASQLKDHLLIVHGTADDNVHPQNTLVVVQELINSDIPFEQAIYPRQKHSFRGPHMRHFHRSMEAFFDRHLR